MKRRAFLNSLSALGLSQALPLESIANTLTADALTQAHHEFQLALKSEPQLAALKGLSHDLAPHALKLEGKLPKTLRGELYRNGPARHSRNNQRYLHLFEGDGMLQKFSFSDDGIWHQGRFVRTSKFTQEEQAERFLYSGINSQISNSLAASSPNSINTANTSVMAVDDEIWALWEGGSATALDRQSLETKSLVNLGVNTRYGNTLKGLPFSAHPKVEANGEIWNFGMNYNGQVVIYHLDPSGKPLNVGMIHTDYQGGMLHDFLITTKHVLIILPSLTQNKHKQGLLSAIEYQPKQAMQALLIDKNSLKLVRRYELEAGFAFHYGNAWEDKHGTVHFDACLYPDASIIQHLGNLTRGDLHHAFSRSQSVFYQLRSDGSHSFERIEGFIEFPSIHPHTVGKANRYLYHTSSKHETLWSDSIRQLDIKTERQKHYFYGKEFLVEEHIPVSPKRSEGNGFLLGTAFHVPSKRTCLNIFREQDIEDGPICRAWLEHGLPLGFHGKFVM